MSTTTAFAGGKLIVLRSNDGEIFEVEEAVAAESQTIKNMMEDVSVDDVITLPNVDAKTLSRVIEYYTKHVETGTEKSDELKAFDSGFVNDVDWNALAELILAANYLNIKGLMDLTCQNAADRIKDKPVEEVRRMFDIENDYTPAEELAVRKEHLWAFE